MQLVPCFRGPTAALAGSVLVLALITAACSGGSLPSASSPASLPSVPSPPSPPASPVSPAASAEPTAAEPVATPAPPTQPPPTEAPATPSAPPATASGPPPAPTGLDYGIERGVVGEGGLVMTRYTVAWSAPLDPRTSISVFGVISCPTKRTPSNPPCVTESTRLPAEIRELIVMGPATDGSISWDWPEADVDGPVLVVGPDGTSYYAFVVRAVNDAGRSPFVVVRSTVACSDCMS